ncbi:MAG: S8 family serine peptidase, partial [Bacteroidetes bacterium]|nr:S8 family serine peptidase [Bacteroidota bacterium]
NIRLTYEIWFSKHGEVESLIKHLKKNEFIEYAEKKERHVLFLTPNDLGNNSTTGQWGLHKIRAQFAWDISTGSSEIIVAVTDDAIVTTHVDLASKFVPGRDVANNDNNTNPPANSGSLGNHGTHVSGTVGSATNNGTGIASIGYNVKIMPVKIGRDSDGILTSGYEGIQWAAQNGAHVINMSWGGGSSSSYGLNIVNAAHNSGALLIAASGNDNVSSVFFPAGYANVMAISSTTTNDSKSNFSNFGSWITVSAPGSSIRSTLKNGGYGNLSGTSMASPLVAGLAGLLKSIAPNLTPNQLRQCIISTADNINAANAGHLGLLGSGRINAEQAALCALASSYNFDAAIETIINPTGVSCGSSITPSVVLKNYGQTTLTAVQINYSISNGPSGVYNWAGSLTNQATTVIQLPVLSLSAGNYTFTASTSIPNNNADQNPSNDASSASFAIFNTNSPLPFTENFESNSFTTNSWFIDNPDQGSTWSIITSQGTSPGNKSARMNFFNYATVGQRDALVTKPLDFTGYASVNLSFEHAYRRKNTSSTDSLIIYVSTDCGNNFTRVFARGENGTGTFATATTSTTSFSPTSSSNWCMGTVGPACFNINLSQFIGETNVFVKFESYNNNGNNFFIDNINIIGTGTTPLPVASFSVSQSTVCEGSTIDFDDLSSPAVTSWDWSFQGGFPATSNVKDPTITYPTAGTYNVSLTVSNVTGSNTYTYQVNVNPLPAPPVISQLGQDLSVAPMVSTGGFIWFVNGLKINGITGQNFTPSVTGDYTAEVTDINGCKSLSSPFSYAIPPPVSAYATSSNTVCEGKSVSFTDQSTATVNAWSWSFPGGTPSSSNSKNPFISYHTPGTYPVTLTVTNSAGSNTHNSGNITVLPNPPKPFVSMNGSNLECSTPGVNYLWNFNFSIIPGETDQT